MISRTPPKWESMLPGPPSRSNAGASDISAAGLLAYASGSSISVVDIRSMQLITVVPLPPPSSSSSSATTSSLSSASSSLSPFATAVRWSPYSLRRVDILSTATASSSAAADDVGDNNLSLSSPYLHLACGDRHGRISLVDVRSRSVLLWFDSDPKVGVQDLCWIQSGHDTWIVAAICGPHLLSLYSATTGKCFLRYNAASSSDYLSCIRRDPYDHRHFVVLGLKGLLLSVRVSGEESEDDVALQELQIRTDSSELGKLERDLGGGGASSLSSTPASAMFPNYPAKCAFSPEWRHVLFVTFPRELVVFDLQYETALFAASLPRGGKFMDVLPDPNSELLYSLHLDGKLSTWKRRE